MTDALAPLPVDVAALERLAPNDRVDVLATAYQGWQRIEATAAWTFGCALRLIRGNYQRGEWGGVLDRIGIHPETARRFMRLADGDNPQFVGYLTVDEGLKLLGPKRPAPEPAAPEPTPARPSGNAPHAVERGIVMGEVNVAVPSKPIESAPVSVAEPSPEAVVEAVAAEESPNVAAEQREALQERWAIRTEHEDGDEIERLNRIIDRMEVRHRADVAAVNDARKVAAAERRKNADIREALLSAPGCPTCAGVLAKFAGVQRPAA